MQSPQSYSNGFGQPGMYSTPAAQGRRTRGAVAYPGRQSLGATPTGNSSGILPTPDPTVGSCMSEEDKDVALQLMRLGEMSNISHGRTSASTLDDTFSGRADAASSTGATSDEESDSEDELPPARRQKRETSPILPPGAIKRFRPLLDDILPSQDSTEPSGDEADYEFKPGEVMDDAEQKSKSMPSIIGEPRTSASGAKVNKSSKPKAQRPGQIVKSKKSASVSGSTKPISPTSLPSQSRKTSNASNLNFQHQLGEDEEDLSSKPRCQRCRKSKKGCDRQRPCQRCKDAGLSADQCVSEDEGNGRKGRYGRHMGVPVKKDETGVDISMVPSILAGGQGSPDKSKKRKR
jgi:Fungal Zn(2)-Cys(6) binuclear cluster domain